MTLPVTVIILGTILFTFYAWRFNRQLESGVRPQVAEGSTDGQDILVRKAVPAHAARARKMVQSDDDRFTVGLPARVQDMFNQDVDTTSKHLGIVSGSSCTRYGFKDGDLFLGDFINDRDELHEGDFVVIDAKAEGSNISQRIRRIQKVGEWVEFNADDKGRPHRARQRSEIVARITHILA